MENVTRVEAKKLLEEYSKNLKQGIFIFLGEDSKNSKTVMCEMNIFDMMAVTLMLTCIIQKMKEELDAKDGNLH